MRTKIYISRDRGALSFGLSAFIKRCVLAALRAERVDRHCEINIRLTNNRGIRRVNNKTRGQNKATDVLSFPAHDFVPGEFTANNRLLDANTGLLPLGDMLISMEMLRRQARRYGHSLKREAAYLAVHSALHLLGYDHIDEGAKKAQMRKREEEILELLNISRR